MPKIELIQGDCLEKMKAIPDKSIDMVLTSPPYDNLRTYNGNLEWGEHIWKPVIQELFRVVKDGGVVVWVVGDATIKGSETGTSFKQALYFKEVGFNLHDTMIWRKTNPVPQFVTIKRYTNDFEYMFIFSKNQPSTFNVLETKSKTAGKKINRNTHSAFASESADRPRDIVTTTKETKRLTNTWDIGVGSRNKDHPAIFPEKLAHDHIISWSNEGDIILDPFAGSGTVGKMAKQLNRNCILIENVSEYCKIAEKRINENL